MVDLRCGEEAVVAEGEASPDVHYVHGLGTAPQQSDWPALCESELSALLEQFYDVGALREISWHSPRPFSSAARIKTTKGVFFMKRHAAALRSQEDILEEHRFIRFLAGKQIPVVRLVPSRNGETALALHGWTYELHYMGRGEDVYRDHTSWTPFIRWEHAYQAGEMLARLHGASYLYGAPARSTRLLITNARLFGQVDPMAALERAVVEQPAVGEYLDQHMWRTDVLERVVQPFHVAAYQALQRGPVMWGHGDWHGSNALWSSAGGDAQMSTVLDFGLADRSSAFLDVAVALERSMVSWLDMEGGQEPVAQLEHVTAFLRGYAGVSGWGDAECSAVADVLPIAHADFSVSEIDFFYGILKNIDNANLAYQGYLLGHADWFQSSEGKRLLRHIRQVNL
nr:phosphotransferase [Neokomagataea tanensis]